mmetsp:Transcript_35298/g.99177  ORF Transcript_35298/g.99177 Transcript_35298/m.99177 type:complete len:293 (+) Transcript_35298:688-1566(+)
MLLDAADVGLLLPPKHCSGATGGQAVPWVPPRCGHAHGDAPGESMSLGSGVFCMLATGLRKAAPPSRRVLPESVDEVGSATAPSLRVHASLEEDEESETEPRRAGRLAPSLRVHASLVEEEASETEPGRAGRLTPWSERGSPRHSRGLFMVISAMKVPSAVSNAASRSVLNVSHGSSSSLSEPIVKNFDVRSDGALRLWAKLMRMSFRSFSEWKRFSETSSCPCLWRLTRVCWTSAQMGVTLRSISTPVSISGRGVASGGVEHLGVSSGCAVACWFLSMWSPRTSILTVGDK